MENIRLCIKVCPDPQCDAVFHNIPKNITKCEDCNGNIMEINKKTFFKKFVNQWFQYDYQSRNEEGSLLFMRLQPSSLQLEFEF